MEPDDTLWLTYQEVDAIARRVGLRTETGWDDSKQPDFIAACKARIQELHPEATPEEIERANEIR